MRLNERDDLSELRLDGRAAIVTGAARGLGRAISELLCRRGAQVALVDSDGPSLERTAADLGEAGLNVLSLTADVSDPNDARGAVAECQERWDRVDILVNNAGIGGRQVPLWEIDDEEWRRVMAVNLDGVFYMCRAVAPQMIQSGYGRIVNIASIAGKEGNAHHGQYSTSKAGVIGLTKSLGKELATTGVLVNAVAPATIETDIIRAEGIDPKVRDLLIAKIPMGRVGRPIEVARLVGFLVSEHLSFSTGAVYDLSGGRATY
jgi:3-oxoacyl-[acyl-carrier protein] reductase